jgi:hypothetical protein
MKKPHMPEIRALLRAHTDGLTIAEIHKRMPQVGKEATLRKCLGRMPDAYIDRWTKEANARVSTAPSGAWWCRRPTARTRQNDSTSQPPGGWR